MIHRCLLGLLRSKKMALFMLLVSSSLRRATGFVAPFLNDAIRGSSTRRSLLNQASSLLLLQRRRRPTPTFGRLVLSLSTSSGSSNSSSSSDLLGDLKSVNGADNFHEGAQPVNDASSISARPEKDNGVDCVDSNNTTMTMSPSALNASTTKAYLDGASSSILAIDPADIRISLEPTVVPPELLQENNGSKQSSLSPSELSKADLLRRLPFVSTFRGSANYIANHRNTVAVYHVPGGLLADSDSSLNGTGASAEECIFRDLMNDVALTWLLGMKIVIVVGCRYQIEQRLFNKTKTENSTAASTASATSNAPKESLLPSGLRVTNAEILRIVKEEAGYVRFEVERQLARSLRLQGGGTTSAAASSGKAGSMSNGGGSALSNGDGNGGPSASPISSSSDAGYYDGNVVSGNFYSAQPFGILDGVDYQYTGFVRKVEVEKIRQLHSARDICLLTTLGVSPSGEVFNVNSESLAATVAGAMDASKVLYFTEKELYLRHKVHGNKIQSLRLSDARNLLQYYGVKMNSKGFVTLHTGAEEQARRDELTLDHMDMLLKIGWCTGAINAGVKRAHIISPQHGSLLQELYTRDGSGTLVSADLYEGIGRATVLDVNAIHAIISPLIEAGTLIDRPKAQLEKDIDSYYIYTRDTHIIACGQLKKFEDGYAEIGCLVVNKDFRSRGRGDAMLGYLERLCLLNGCTNIFVLSTQTMEWFVERGFDEADVSKLPPSRQATYNHKRASKVYIKKIESDRDLDASELWWNR